MAEQLSGVQAESLNLDCYCASGGGYLGGGAPAPRYQGPLERLSREAGRPMGPSTPRYSSQSCAVFVLVRLLGSGILFGKFMLVCCFGTSIFIRLPFKLRPCKGSLSSRQFVREMFAFGRFSICMANVPFFFFFFFFFFIFFSSFCCL